MARQSRNIPDDGYNRNSVNLLLSILFRYPQISTIKFLEEGTFRFTFLFKDEELDQQKIAEEIEKYLRVHCQLLGQEPQCCNVQFHSLGTYGRLDVLRGLATLTGAEISLLINVVQNALGSQLIVEQPESTPSEDAAYQDELISVLLEDLQDCPKGHTLYGMRENGLVLVFNHQDLDFRR